MSGATTRTGTAGPFALSDSDLQRLERHVVQAQASARAGLSRGVGSVSVELGPDVDPSAIVLAGRRVDERFFCVEQPAREGHAIAALGVAAGVEASGNRRFSRAAQASRHIAGRTFADRLDEQAPPGAGPVFTGGFAFDPEGAAAPEWGDFAPLGLCMPRISLVRRGGRCVLTVNVGVDGEEDPEALVRGVQDRLSQLERAELPLLDPDPVNRPRVAGAAPPSHYEEAVSRAVERIRAGELAKIVLARVVRVHAGAAHDPAPVFDVLRQAFAECYCYCTGQGESAFIGASPELLIRRDGAAAQTVALAGTTRRSADPAVDDHLGQQLLVSAKNANEHRIVARRIERELESVSLWVTAAPDPQLVKVQNVQHLATPIRAQLADPVSALELAGRLHPTPAVGGEPRAVAEPLIPALEGFDRGWYAGGVGWTDLAEDGEFCVALRCALLDGPVAHLYAGCGIVGDSVAEEELAETETKFAALLPLLS